MTRAVIDCARCGERNPAHAATCIARMEATEPGESSRKAKQLALGGVR